ncbi:MAG: class I SAM-dependent methyltransferase [bacterium]
MDNFKIRLIRKLALRNNERKPKLLDVGCREGGYSIIADKEGFKVISVDINYTNRLKNFVMADIKKLPFKDSYFDCICAFDVIEHVTETNYALHECKRVLKEGGDIVISVPNNDLLVRTYFRMIRRTPLSTGDETHKAFYTNREWIQIIKNFFQIEAIYYQIVTEGEKLYKIKYFINKMACLFKFGSNTFFLCKKVD